MTTVTTYQKEIHYMGVKIYNSLPQSIKEVSKKDREFEICLKWFLHTRSFYSLDEYFQHKSSANLCDTIFSRESAVIHFSRLLPDHVLKILVLLTITKINPVAPEFPFKF